MVHTLDLFRGDEVSITKEAFISVTLLIHMFAVRIRGSSRIISTIR